MPAARAAVVRSLHRRVLRAAAYCACAPPTTGPPGTRQPWRTAGSRRRASRTVSPCPRAPRVVPRAAARPHPREPHPRSPHHRPVQRLDGSLRVGATRELNKPAALTRGDLHVHQLPERLEVRAEVRFRQRGVQPADEDGAARARARRSAVRLRLEPTPCWNRRRAPPPTPSTPLRGIASEIRITRDPHGTPFISTSALSRSPSSPKRTNPKPLLLPARDPSPARAFRTEGYLSANVSCRA